MTQAIELLRDANDLPTGDPSSMVFVRTLGAASIDAGGTHLTPSSTRKFSLLFYLWAERGRSVTRGVLHDMIFPDQTPVKARHSIRELIYQFRKLGARIASDGETVELAPESIRADYSDVLRQERPSIDLMRAAEGGFMPGFAPPHSEAFTEWLEGFRGRATLELNRVFCAELSRARRVGDWTLAEAAARAVLALDPLHEEATLSMAEMLAIGGAKAQAVRMLDRYVAEVGAASPDLKVPAAVLRRRISERSREIYRAPLTLPFLGRDAEMSALQERFSRARAGEAQCAVLVGEAGIGKTRVAEELCTQAVLAGARVERVATQPHDTHRPMATFADLVPKLLELPGALGCSPESMAALKRLTNPGAAAVISESNEGSGEVVAAAISRALADLVDSIASESPLVIFVDDAQWTDERSRQSLASLTAARHARRLLIVLTSRDRALAQVIAQRTDRAVCLTLAPLTAESTQELTRRALSEQSTDRQLEDWIASTSGGSPFFLKCLIGHYQATSERFVVPTTLSVLLDQKVAALSPNAGVLLATCVALGRHSEVERVLRTLEMAHIDLQLAAAELEAANLVVQTGPRIEPAHSLIVDAVDRLSSPLVARLIHRRVASVLEHEAPSSGSSVLLWDCAEHWALAGEQERAADFLQRCAAKANEIGRPREAAELLLRAASMVGREAAIPLATRATEIADVAQEGDIVKRAISLLRTLNVRIELDSLELAELHARLTEWDDPECARDRFEAWLASSAPLQQRVAAATDMLIMAEVDARPDMARQVYDQLISELPRPAECQDNPTLLLLLIYHCVFGDLDQAELIVSQLLKLQDAVPPAVATDIYRKCGAALWRLGLVDQAYEVFKQCYRSAKTLGLHKVEFDVVASLHGIQMDFPGLGDGDDWLPILDASVSEHAELEGRPSNAIVRLDCACCTGDLAEARKWLDAGRRLCEDNRLVRLQRWIRTAELRVRQLAGDLPTIDEARRLVAHHKPRSEVGDISDFEVAVAGFVLCEHDEPEQAATLTTRYLEINRRSRGPLTLMLRNAIAQANRQQRAVHPATGG